MTKQSRYSLSVVLTVLLLVFASGLVGCAGIKAATPGGNNGGGSIPQPTIASFTSSPSAVDSGQTATLTWTSQNATAVTLNGAAVELNGSKSVTVASTTTYTLVATGASGTTPGNATATVTVNPKIVSFKASSTVVGIGQSTTLTWETVGATTVTLNGSPVNASGTSSPVLTEDTACTLTAMSGTQ